MTVPTVILESSLRNKKLKQTMYIRHNLVRSRTSYKHHGKPRLPRCVYAGLIMLMLVSACTTGQPMPSPDAVKTPEPFEGKVDVGGHALYLRCVGSGTPTVLLETGLNSAGSSEPWQTIQQEVASFAYVCAYDRAGLGQSDPGPTPRNSEQMVAELHTLLEKAEIAGPYVLVGHSFGGFNTRLYAAQHPDAVAGMVLIESAHERQMEVMQAHLPAEMWSRMSQGMARNPEGVDLEQSASQVAETGKLGPKPLYVVTRGRAESLPPMVPADVAEALEQAWRTELQADLLGLSTQSRQLIAEEAGHNVHIDQPDIIVEAIRQVIEATNQ